MRREAGLYRLGGLCAALVLGHLLGGCEDECEEGVSECISDALIRTCVPADDGPQWLVHQCAGNTACDPEAGSAPANEREEEEPPMDGGSPDGSMDGDSGVAQQESAATAAPNGAACIGTCDLGQSECVGDALARHCIAGGLWQLDMCQIGERCQGGQCRLSQEEGTVQACEAGSKACASDRVEKACDEDGTTWVFRACPANQICQEDGCAPDPESSCDDGNQCLDNKTAIRCLGQDEGFELVECEGDTYCEFGRCRGAGCVIGSTCNGNQVRECSDGLTLVDQQCGVNEVCVQDKDQASCQPRACNVGTTVCGDPLDDSVDPTQFYTTCIPGQSGAPELVRGECDLPTTCNPAAAGSGTPCTAACTPGAQRCASSSGDVDGFQECDEEGNWGPITRCNDGTDARLLCTVKPSLDASVLPEVLCADPVCAWLFTNRALGSTIASAADGACEQGQVVECADDGTLGNAKDCEAGVCRDSSAPMQADGRTPGGCDVAPQCEPDEEICHDGPGGTPTPRYRRCQDGVWTTQLFTCADDTLCQDYRNGDGEWRKLCDADCAPGSRQCDDGELRTCDDDGTWGAAQACPLGSCRALSGTDAACQLECVPGEVRCAGITKSAADGANIGTDSEQSCGEDGTFGGTTTCGADEACRISAAGVHTGCVECLGPDVPGGNANGLADTRCDPTDATKIQDCGGDNTWSDATTCSDSMSCVGPTAATCSTCTGLYGTTFQCTETNIRSEPLCGPCVVALPGGGTAVAATCSQASVATLASDTSGMACTAQSLGAPGAWGSVPDCCSNAQTTAGAANGATCLSLGFGTPGAYAGVPDCCSSARLGGGGPGFAYCAP